MIENPISIPYKNHPFVWVLSPNSGDDVPFVRVLVILICVTENKLKENVNILFI